jgi:hypothetical protein
VDGTGAEVCCVLAKSQVSSASAGAVRAKARDRRRLGEAGGLNAVAAAPPRHACDVPIVLYSGMSGGE